MSKETDWFVVSQIWMGVAYLSEDHQLFAFGMSVVCFLLDLWSSRKARLHPTHGG